MDLHVLTHSFPTRRSSALHLLLLQRELQGGVPGEPCRLRHLMAAFGAALVVVLAAGSALVVTRWAGRAVDRAHLTAFERDPFLGRSEEHTSELQSLMRISYAVFCLKKKK